MKAVRFFNYSMIAIILGLSTMQIQAQENDLPDLKGWLDDKHYLEERITNKGETQLWKVNAKNGKAKLYHESTHMDAVNEALPEGFSISRMTVHTENYEKNIFIKDDDLYYYDHGKEAFKQLTDNPEKEINPAFSPDESKIAFTRNNNLFVIDLESWEETRLTNDGTDLLMNGYMSWVYWEEIFGRSSRYKAFWWSPDSKKIAFEQFNDHPVPRFPVMDFEELHTEIEWQRYPKAGDPNPGVKLAVADVESGELTWIADNEKEDIYIAFPFWTPDSQELTYQVLNRDQNHMEIYAADPVSGKSRMIYEEKQDTWIEFFESIYFMEDGSGFVLNSDRDGWRNLYFYGMDGELKNRITDVDWRVNEVLAIDEKDEWIYFTGTGEKSVDRHFYKAKLDGSAMIQLTGKSGQHSVELSPDYSYFIDKYNAIDVPWRYDMMNTDGELLWNMGAREPLDPEENELTTVEMFYIPTEDGFEMPAYWVLPPNFDPDKKYGVVFSIYGGPNYKGVENSYVSRKANFLSQENIIVFKVDHRGSGHFGKKGLNYLHRSLGQWEIEDYKTAVDWLTEHSFVDSTKIGITGGSYGGYMSCLALTKAPEHFTHGFGSSAVTDWRFYDNVYTERYMDKPQDNKEGYDAGSVLTHAENLEGKLYIVHGTMDDNVHLQNMIELIDEFTDHNKDFDMMLYPKGRHGWGYPKYHHTMREMQEFWQEHLGME